MMHMHMSTKGGKMHMPMEDSKLKEIMRWIAKHPGKNLYQLPGDLKGMNRTTAMRKIKDQYRLIERDFLRMEKGKRNAEQLHLTFKGLLLSLDIEAIKPDEAASVRQESSIKEPYTLNPMMKEYS